MSFVNQINKEMRDLINLVEHGTDRPTTNNLGRPIASSPTALNNFWNWFGASKIVDAKGQPIVVHHGTKTSFKVFNPDRSDSNTQTGVPHGAFVFTNSPQNAATYANQKTKDWGFDDPALQAGYDRLTGDENIEARMEFFRRHATQDVKSFGDGGNVMSVYLKAMRPLKVNAKGDYWNHIYFKNDDYTTNELMEYALLHGYDALIVRNVHDRQNGKGPTSDTYAVFDPSQIKSSIGNNGKFSNSHAIDEEELEEDWDDYLRIGHKKGSTVYYMMPGGKLITHEYNGKKDNHDQNGPEMTAICVGRIDNTTKEISIRTPLAPGNSWYYIPEAKMEFIIRKLSRQFPGYSLWYFGNAASDIRKVA
jgi:hypothetical protein